MVLKKIGELSGVDFIFEKALIGGSAIDQKGTPLPQVTVDLCLNSDAVLLGAVGGPKCDDLPSDKRPEKGLLGIRKSLDLYAYLRPAIVYEPLFSSSPLKVEVARGTDFIVVRELTGDVYYGEPRVLIDLGKEKVRSGEEFDVVREGGLLIICMAQVSTYRCSSSTSG